VDENWNSTYPYVVGPTFYGVKNGSKVQTISETVTTYTPTVSTGESIANDLSISVFPNPSGDFFAVQTVGLLREKATINLYDLSGKLMQTSQIQPGSTISYLDVRTLYSGMYLISVTVEGVVIATKNVVVE
jgi:hypothetical protein